MNGKKFVVILILAVLITAAGTAAVTAYAIGGFGSPDSRYGDPAMMDRPGAPQGSAEDQPQPENEVWNTLSAEQKEEVYTAQDQVLEAESSYIDKLLALGLMDQEQAAQEKERLTQQSTQSRESGRMPMYFGGGGSGDFRGAPPNEPNGNATNNNSADS